MRGVPRQAAQRPVGPHAAALPAAAGAALVPALLKPGSGIWGIIIQESFGYVGFSRSLQVEAPRARGGASHGPIVSLVLDTRNPLLSY